MYPPLPLSWPGSIGRREGGQALRNRNKHAAKSNQNLPICARCNIPHIQGSLERDEMGHSAMS
jgi:hypothetical protein